MTQEFFRAPVFLSRHQSALFDSLQRLGPPAFNRKIPEVRDRRYGGLTPFHPAIHTGNDSFRPETRTFLPGHASNILGQALSRL